MIDRYLTLKISKIWSMDTKLELWKKFQLANVKALVKLNYATESEYNFLRQHSKVNKKLMFELEEITHHDVVAFTRMLGKSISDSNARKWIHFGLTSTDMVDTVQNYQLFESGKIIRSDAIKLLEIIKKLALKHKKTLIMGRTHGIDAEPMSLGLKLVNWYQELHRALQNLDTAIDRIGVVKLSGSLGNYIHCDPIQTEVIAREFGLKIDLINSQVTSRDRHAYFIVSLATIGNLCEKIALQLRLLQQSEIAEIAEGFSKNQKGSSSMPHKKNPISSENIMGMARFIRSHVNLCYENNLLWEERDISHSSNERIMFPDVCHATHYIVKRLTNVLENIVINKEAIQKNIDANKNIFYSQLLLTEILKWNKNISREEGYDFIQHCTLQAQKEKRDFIEVLTVNGLYKYIDRTKVNKICNLSEFLKNINFIYDLNFS